MYSDRPRCEIQRIEIDVIGELGLAVGNRLQVTAEDLRCMRLHLDEGGADRVRAVTCKQIVQSLLSGIERFDLGEDVAVGLIGEPQVPQDHPDDVITHAP